jgi:hypothetical protein
MVMMMMGQQRLILGVVAELIGLLQVLQDDIHYYQDVAGCARILGDLRDRGHAKVHQDLGYIPH